MDTADGALVQLRAYIAQGSFAADDRLPPKRKLCETLGVTCFAEHESILEALEERDAERSERLMREHLRSVGTLLFPTP